MPKTSNHWKQTLTATEKMDAARRATKEIRKRDLLAAGIYARLWPSYMAHSKGREGRQDEFFPWVLHIESPEGRLSYRLSTDDAGLFMHVTDRRSEYVTSSTQAGKQKALETLVAKGW